MLLPDITCDAGVVNPAVAIEEYIFVLVDANNKPVQLPQGM
jgi:hypothetical protein